MAFIGRWFGSIATAYREMNQATLTGAIDVIVVRQPDGSLRASPFHVRFGKAGILRPRDKIVDITLNGDPVELKMKLGDAGEAFFVELKDDESMVAPYLCTSPLPAEDAQKLMERGLEEMRSQCDANQVSSQPAGDSPLRPPTSTGTVLQNGSKSTTSSNSDGESGKETFNGGSGRLVVDRDAHAAATGAAVDPPPATSTPFRPAALSSIDALMADGSDEASSFGAGSSTVTSKPKVLRRKRKKSNSKKSPGSAATTTTTTTTSLLQQEETPTAELFSDDIFVCEIERGDDVVERSGAAAGWSSDEEEETPHSEAPPGFPTSSSAGGGGGGPAMTASLDIGDDLHHFPSRAISRSLPQDVAAAAANDHKAIHDAPAIAAGVSTRSLLVNDIRGKVGFGYTSDNKGGAYSFGDTPVGDLHPFSDGDLTPLMGSPINRPFSPQSDSELLERPSYLTAKSDRFSNVNWSWGQLPRMSNNYDQLHQVIEESQDSLAFETPAQTPVRETVGDDQGTIPPDAGKNDGTGVPFSLDQSIPPLPIDTTAAATMTMTTTSASDAVTAAVETQKTPPGLTLEQLDQMEPEVKALYLAQPTRQDGLNGQSLGKVVNDRRSEILRDDDAESATGSSLPQSPRQFEYGAGSSGFGSDAEGHSTVNRDISDPTSPCCRHHQFLSKHGKSSDECECDPERIPLEVGSPRPPSSSPDFIGSDSSSPPDPSQHPDILLSLCGGLKGNREVNDECFQLGLITFDEFCEDPEGILANPDLVVKVGDHYYTWLVASPVLLSMGAFGRPLPNAAVDVLLKKHQPQSESRPSISESRKKSSGGVASWFYWGSKEDESVVSSSAPSLTSLNESMATPPPALPQVGTEASTIPIPQKTATAMTSTTPMTMTIPTTEEEAADVADAKAADDVVLAIDEEDTKKQEYIKSIRLTPEQLAKLPLKEGPNDIVFSVTTSYQGTSRAEASIFLWNWDDKLIVSDIDGTITKSDVLGQILPIVGKDWSQDGITSLYRHIVENGYRIIYLSARAIGQAGITRSYLQSIRQESNSCLPNGPLLLSPSSLLLAFHREVIEKKPEEFKIGCLKDIAKLFPWKDGASTPTLEAEIQSAQTVSADAIAENISELNTPFFAGFGNKTNDVIAYRAVGVPLPRIFTVNHRGEICHELLKNYRTSYTSLKEMADHVFPYIFKDESFLTVEEHKAVVSFRPNSRSESEVVAPSRQHLIAKSLQERERSYSNVDMASASSSISPSPQHQRARRSGSAAPKCFFYEGEQYSSFAYWREPLVNMDDEISGLAEAMKL